jgi:predicted DNA binding CopG/RHH family protein
MVAKKVSMGAKPKRSAKPISVDDWVDSRGKEDAPPATTQPVKMKRLTLDIPESLHKAIKVRSVEQGVAMVDMLRILLNKHYGSK